MDGRDAPGHHELTGGRPSPLASTRARGITWAVNEAAWSHERRIHSRPDFRRRPGRPRPCGRARPVRHSLHRGRTARRLDLRAEDERAFGPRDGVQPALGHRGSGEGDRLAVRTPERFRLLHLDVGLPARAHDGAVLQRHAPALHARAGLRLRADILRPDPARQGAVPARRDHPLSHPPRFLHSGRGGGDRDGHRPAQRRVGIAAGAISGRVRRGRRHGACCARGEERGAGRHRHLGQRLFPLGRADAHSRDGLGALLPVHRRRWLVGRDHRHRRQGAVAAFGAEGSARHDRRRLYPPPRGPRRRIRDPEHPALGAARMCGRPLSRPAGVHRRRRRAPEFADRGAGAAHGPRRRGRSGLEARRRAAGMGRAGAARIRTRPSASRSPTTT